MSEGLQGGQEQGEGSAGSVRGPGYQGGFEVPVASVGSARDKERECWGVPLGGFIM